MQHFGPFRASPASFTGVGFDRSGRHKCSELRVRSGQIVYLTQILRDGDGGNLLDVSKEIKVRKLHNLFISNLGN